MKITIDLRILILLIVGVLLLAGGLAVLAQSTEPLPRSYTPNGNTSLYQYADTNAPVVGSIAAGQTVALYQPHQLNDLLWWAAVNPEGTQWVAYASIGRCQQVPFGRTD